MGHQLLHTYIHKPTLPFCHSERKRRISSYFLSLLLSLFISTLFSLCLINSATMAGWKTETIDSKGDVGYGISLAFDSSDNPAISYLSTDEGSNDTLKYARFNVPNPGWNITTIAAEGMSEETSLAFDASGNPAIAYYDLSNYDLKYARFVPCQCDASSPMGCISGTVTKVGTGEPLAGKTVVLRRKSPNPVITVGTTTDNNGCYSFTDLVNGTYKIKVRSRT